MKKLAVKMRKKQNEKQEKNSYREPSLSVQREKQIKKQLK
jgi:hypothetical protein